MCASLNLATHNSNKGTYDFFTVAFQEQYLVPIYLFIIESCTKHKQNMFHPIWFYGYYGIYGLLGVLYAGKLQVLRRFLFTPSHAQLSN